jgi:hypothetical protein
VAVLLTGVSWSVVAGDKEEAKQLFDAGLRLMRLDDFAGASADFERSVALYPTQNSLFNLANCYKALQRYGDAIAAVERLKRDFADKLKPEIKEAIERQQQEIQSLVARLTLQTVPADATIRVDGKDVGTGPMLGPLLLGPGEHEIEAARPGYRSQRRLVKLVSGAGRSEKLELEVETGQVVVRANVAGAAVFVDGQQAGITPLAEALSLSPGKHVLNLRAADHEDVERTVEVRAGTREDLDVVLIAKLAPNPVLVMGGAPASAGPEISVSATGAGTPKSKSRALTVVTWSALGGAVAAGLVAGVFLIVRNGQKNDFEKYDNLYAKEKDPNVRAADDSKRRAAIDNLNRSGLVAIGCGIGAGALAVTAILTYLFNPSGEERKTTVSLSPVGLGVRF